MKSIRAGIAALALTAVNLRAQSPHTLPDSLAAPGTPVLTQRETQGTVFAEGVASDWDGNVYFNEMDNNNRTLRLPVSGGEAKVWRQAKDTPNGMWVDPEGRLVICQAKAIVRVSTANPFDGKTDTLYKVPPQTAANFNDVTGDSKGNLYFTDFSGTKVFFRSAAGQTREVLTGKPNPNGIEWDEERGIVYVLENSAGWVRTYTVTEDYSLTEPKDFAQVPACDGVTLDEFSNVYAVEYSGDISVFSPGGQLLGKILFGGGNHQLTNLAFGGADFKTLYMINNKGLYALPMKVKGYKAGNYTVSVGPRLTARRSEGALSRGSLLRLDGRRLTVHAAGKSALPAFPLPQNPAR